MSELYPDYKINVDKEQDKLLCADIIVLQYSVFWYSRPSLIEKWIKDVFKYGFLHGSIRDKLKNKKLVVSLTTGVPK